MSTRRPPRPRLSLPFTVLTAGNTVRLIAGEDVRYTLTGPRIESWLPGLLSRCDGRRRLDELLAEFDPVSRSTAQSVIERLYGERVLVDGAAADAHQPARFRLLVEGNGPLAEALTRDARLDKDSTADPLRVLCQDRLDYDAALQFNRRCLSAGGPWLWATTGPQARAYVSPAFLPDAGPCLTCLLRHFERRSPAPELYAALVEHARAGGLIEAAAFVAEGVEIVRQLVLWKLAAMSRPIPSAALYRLHVLDAVTFEISTHRVFADPECPDCRDVRLA